MHCVTRIHKGCVRENNQDCLIQKRRLFGVADGMGGHQGGETASQIAVKVVCKALSHKKPSVEALENAVDVANQKIFKKAQGTRTLQGMGTTLTFLWEGNRDMLIAHVGDSRAYLLRDHVCQQITQDHSLVGELLRKNQITAEQARRHPYRNVITRAVGVDAAVVVDIYRKDKKKGDIWLVCSDGLYNMVDDESLAEILQQNSLEESADKLLNLALVNGGTDNISFVLGLVTEDGVS